MKKIKIIILDDKGYVFKIEHILADELLKKPTIAIRRTIELMTDQLIEKIDREG